MAWNEGTVNERTKMGVVNCPPKFEGYIRWRRRSFGIQSLARAREEDAQ